MTIRKLFVLAPLAVAAMALFVAFPVSAHHSTAASYDTSQRLSFTGTLRNIDWRHPHMSIIVDAVGDDGQVETWEFEGPPPGWIDRERLEDALDKTVRIEASPAWDGSRLAAMRIIELPGGFSISLCPQHC